MHEGIKEKEEMKEYGRIIANYYCKGTLKEKNVSNKPNRSTKKTIQKRLDTE